MIRGKCHTFSDLCFVKGQTVGVGWGGGVCGGGVLAISQNSPRGAPQGAALRNKNSMCGALRVCVFVCLRPGLENRTQFEQRCRVTVLFNDKKKKTHNNKGDKQWPCEGIGAETAGIEDFDLRMNASITLIILYLRLRTPTPSLILPLISVAPFSLLLALI